MVSNPSGFIFPWKYGISTFVLFSHKKRQEKRKRYTFLSMMKTLAPLHGDRGREIKIWCNFYERGLSLVPFSSMNEMGLAFLGFYWWPIHSTSSTSRWEQPWLSGGGCWALLWRLREAYQWTYEGYVCLPHINSI